MIKAVFFDIDDTLYSFRDTHKIAMESLYKYAQECLHVDKDTFCRTLKEVQDKLIERLGENSAVIHNRLIRFQNVLGLLGKPIHPYAREMYSLYWDTLLLYAVPEPGLRELLQELKAQGIYIGIGTDMTSYIQVKKLEKLGVAEFIDCIVTSEEAGVEKPEKELFDLCLEKAGLEPRECLFIGDNCRKDILGAKNAGMYYLCYCKYCDCVDVDERYCIKSYEDTAKFEELGIL
ncbi:MAG: HAD-IA family hydrolase [Eubacteriales bacterium]|nr:HAD-IA family hydrolase [Eubacteriales bacterium]